MHTVNAFSLLYLITGKAGMESVHGMEGRRAVFLSVQGGGRQVDPVSNKPLDIGVIMTYVVPVKHSGK